MKLLHALGALFKPGLGATTIASLGNGAVIFGTEVLAKLLGAPPLKIENDGAKNHHNDGDDDTYLDGGKILHVHDPGPPASMCLDTV
jgi:hypothetical protein